MSKKKKSFIKTEVSLEFRSQNLWIKLQRQESYFLMTNVEELDLPLELTILDHGVAE